VGACVGTPKRDRRRRCSLAKSDGSATFERMQARVLSSILGSAVCVAILGCSAGSGGTGGNVKNNPSGGATGAGAQPSLGGAVGTGATPSFGAVGTGGDGSGGGPGNGCQTGGAMFVPKVPTVMLVVDRSG